MRTADDAGVIRISDDLALVQTVDYFTPIVDDAYDWGRIAACNALSDIYAMGAQPLTALQIVGWPRDALSFELLTTVFLGAADLVAEAGCVIVGGHTLDDPEPKFGLAVTGTAHPDRLLSNAGARPGNDLVLTKPIGTGVVATAIKRGGAPAGVEAETIDSMTTLNAAASAAAVEAGALAATDVTGFGLLGHLHELLDASAVGAEIELSSVPVFAGVRDLVAAGYVPGGTKRNLAHAESFTDFGEVAEPDRILLADAQTSGGLLIAVDDGEAMVQRVGGHTAVIGKLIEGAGIKVR